MRTREEIFEQIREILMQEFELRADEVLPTSHLIDDLDLDSIDAIDMAVKLEEIAGVEVEEKQLRGLRVVQDVVDLVYSHLEAA